MENRSENIRVRLTPEERAAIEKAAREKGYESLSDYIRARLGLR